MIRTISLLLKKHTKSQQGVFFSRMYNHVVPMAMYIDTCGHAYDQRITLLNCMADGVTRYDSIVDFVFSVFRLFFKVREFDRVVCFIANDDIKKGMEARVVILPAAKLRISDYNHFIWVKFRRWKPRVLKTFFNRKHVAV